MRMPAVVTSTSSLGAGPSARQRMGSSLMILGSAASVQFGAVGLSTFVAAVLLAGGPSGVAFVYMAQQPWLPAVVIGCALAGLMAHWGLLALLRASLARSVREAAVRHESLARMGARRLESLGAPPEACLVIPFDASPYDLRPVHRQADFHPWRTLLAGLVMGVGIAALIAAPLAREAEAAIRLLRDSTVTVERAGGAVRLTRPQPPQTVHLQGRPIVVLISSGPDLELTAEDADRLAGALIRAGGPEGPRLGARLSGRPGVIPGSR